MAYGNPHKTIPSQRYLTNPGGEYGGQNSSEIGKVPLLHTKFGKIPASPNSLYQSGILGQNGILGQSQSGFDQPSDPGYMAPPSDPTYETPPMPDMPLGDAKSDSSASAGGDLLKTGLDAIGLVPGIGGLVGMAGGVLSSLFGGNEMERKEDPYTTEGARMLREIGDDDPEKRRRQRDASLATQQGAAVQNALNASGSQLANQGVGGDIAAPNIGAIANSTAAVGAAGQFANARVQSDSQASTEQHDIINQKREIATALADRAKDINLINKQKSNFGSMLGNSLLGGLAGLGSGAGVVGELLNATTGKKKEIKVEDKTKLPGSP